MNKIMIINASPRKEGTSAMLCKRCRDYIGGVIYRLYSDTASAEGLLSKINEAETIILSGPCYINSYPAQVTYLLEKISENPGICHGQKVYGMINGGMPYVHTHESGIRMLKLFCKDSGMDFMGGFVIGLGAMLNGKSLENHFNAKKVVPAFHQFLEHIKKGEPSKDQLYNGAETKIPSLITRFLAYSMNKTIDKNLKKHGFDYKQPSSYWEEIIR